MKPFLKWAGGKRWLFNKELVNALPTFDRYIEPFLGGGAGFFALEPHDAVLSDVNPELINVYEQIRSYPSDIAEGLRDCQGRHSKEFYYAKRATEFTPDISGAVRTLYLNRTCWNGLFRLNLKGRFNVPMGTKSNIYDSNEDFHLYAELLKRADLSTNDFEAVIDKAGAGDLVFVDPPYTVKHNLNGFVKYNESIFEWKDQQRLSIAIRKAIDRGVKVIMTNADHASIRELYNSVGEIYYQNRQSVISGLSHGRALTSELILVA